MPGGGQGREHGPQVCQEGFCRILGCKGLSVWVTKALSGPRIAAFTCQASSYLDQLCTATPLLLKSLSHLAYTRDLSMCPTHQSFLVCPPPHPTPQNTHRPSLALIMATEPDATLLAQDDPAAFYVPLAHGGSVSAASAAADAGCVLRLWGQGAAFEDYEGFLKSLKSAGVWLCV